MSYTHITQDSLLTLLVRDFVVRLLQAILSVACVVLPCYGRWAYVTCEPLA